MPLHRKTVSKKASFESIERADEPSAHGQASNANMKPESSTAMKHVQAKPSMVRSRMRSFRHTAGIKKDDQDHLLLEKERYARHYAESRAAVLFFLDFSAGVSVIVRYLVNFEAILSAVFASVLTWYLYDHADWDANGGTYGESLNWFLLTFVLVMPITTLLRLTYTRRNQQLEHLSSFKAYSWGIYHYHASAQWSGRDDSNVDWLAHSDECLTLLISMADLLTRFLTMPMSGYPRHRETRRGRKEAAVTLSAAYEQFDTLVGDYASQLDLLTERMKKEGFSPSESSRLRQWSRYLVNAMENLREGKLYRTPQSLNALISFFSLVLPSFYAPAFAQVAYNVNSLGFGVAFAAIAAMSVAALYESVRIMEDPFVCSLTIDGVDVYEELSTVNFRQLMRTRKRLFPDAPEFIDGCSETVDTVSSADIDITGRELNPEELAKIQNLSNAMGQETATGPRDKPTDARPRLSLLRFPLPVHVNVPGVGHNPVQGNNRRPGGVDNDPVSRRQQMLTNSRRRASIFTLDLPDSE